MSYEYYLQAHLHQDDQQVPTERILAIFGDYINGKDNNYIDLYFDNENSCTIYIDTADAVCSGFMVSRPCGGKLGECLYDVMLLGNFVFYEPAGIHMITVDPAVEAHLPEDMIDTFGKPAVAQSREHFLELYHNNR